MKTIEKTVICSVLNKSDQWESQTIPEKVFPLSSHLNEDLLKAFLPYNTDKDN